MATEEEVRRVKRQHGPALMKQRGVSGVGIEKDDCGGYVLTVNVDDDDALQQVPEQIEGLPVRRVRSGPFRAGPARG